MLATLCILCYRLAMAAICSVIYVCPRQWFVLPDGTRVAGPDGLSSYFGTACGEDGCYAVAINRDDVMASVVYITSSCYECFCPVGPWHEHGFLADIRGFELLFEKNYGDLDEYDMTFWSVVYAMCSTKNYRVVYAMQAAATVVYLRIRSERMPAGFYAVYRLHGIETKEWWWRATGHAYLGTLSSAEADHVCSTME